MTSFSAPVCVVCFIINDDGCESAGLNLALAMNSLQSQYITW